MPVAQEHIVRQENGTATLRQGGEGTTRPWDREPTPLQLALVRGHGWLAMVESGKVTSLKEIAKREGADTSYVSRMVNLTTLAPDIAAAVFDETLTPNLTLFDLAVDPPPLLDEQRARLANRQCSRRQIKGFGHLIHYPMLNPSS